MHLVTWILVATGLLIAALGVPMWREKIPPNALYGFRTPRTVTDERVWYPVNRVGGRDLFLAGVAMAAIAAALHLAFGPLPTDPQLLAIATLPMAPLVPALAHTFWWASVYVADLDAPPPEREPTGAAHAHRRPRQEREPERER